MLNEYKVVIFKNKTKKKVIKKYKDLNNAILFFDNLIKKNQEIQFEKSLENGLVCDYELLIIGPYQSNKEFFVKDKLGKNIKIYSNDGDFSIYKISEYKLEEKLFHINKKTKIGFSEFIKKYINVSGLKCISKLNNKIIHQIDDKFNLFSCKSDDDCSRFFDYLEDYVFENKRMDCLIVRDFDPTQKKYLYDVLEKNGFSKDFLYRRSTTHLK